MTSRRACTQGTVRPAVFSRPADRPTASAGRGRKPRSCSRTSGSQSAAVSTSTSCPWPPRAWPATRAGWRWPCSGVQGMRMRAIRGLSGGLWRLSVGGAERRWPIRTSMIPPRRPSVTRPHRRRRRADRVVSAVRTVGAGVMADRPSSGAGVVDRRSSSRTTPGLCTAVPPSSGAMRCQRSGPGPRRPNRAGATCGAGPSRRRPGAGRRRSPESGPGRRLRWLR